ncbi:MAG: histidine phosphatase family protein [Methylovulum sp.]|uniref:SixA phosphatase family protein n=1 Tax=Methylovulum sp. TaxID=1916980 RepID=UPI00260706EC|nr:histidine phosphatase family protein [Methylovulum sp.]MDD2724717.1 histidine phosphatase family protein [Methylovulum sp.]MDD5124658.1 histidine phosphatase family protein [Methylovulum sp.]
MIRELWLLRHGKAERDGLIADFQRSLKKSGKQSVRRIGLWLKQQGLKPDFLLTSPATRAFDTASIIVDTLDEDNFLLKQDDRLYFQGPDALKQILVEIPPAFKRVLLVGHNPDFEDLFSYLAGAANLPATDKLLPTAALVRLKMPDDWRDLSLGCAQVLSITYPKSLE